MIAAHSQAGVPPGWLALAGGPALDAATVGEQQKQACRQPTGAPGPTRDPVVRDEAGQDDSEQEDGDHLRAHDHLAPERRPIDPPSM